MVNWTADKDQIILKGIFKFHDIKCTKPLLDYLSAEIGDDCTPKAVSHRLANIRKGGATSATPASAMSTPTKAAATPKKTTPRARATPRGKAAPPAPSDDEEEETTSPSAARGKRNLKGNGKKSYVESDVEDEEGDEDTYAPMTKRVKNEPVEDTFEKEIEVEV